MNAQQVEEVIDRYVNERMQQGKRKAAEHLVTYAYLKYAGGEVVDFLKKVRGLSRYYVNFLKLIQNPFKGPEIAWLASMAVIGIYSIILMMSEEQRMLGILVFSGTVVHALFLMREVARNWREIGVMIAIYSEILEIVESSLQEATATS
jgi:hypothetical protein